jgi:hypothetical protein
VNSSPLKGNCLAKTPFSEVPPKLKLAEEEPPKKKNRCRRNRKRRTVVVKTGREPLWSKPKEETERRTERRAIEWDQQKQNWLLLDGPSEDVA